MSEIFSIICLFSIVEDLNNLPFHPVSGRPILNLLNILLLLLPDLHDHVLELPVSHPLPNPPEHCAQLLSGRLASLER